MLLALPSEIRHQIYTLLLVAPSPDTPRTLGASPAIHPQILRVCTQTNHEATAVLYRKNTFIAHYALLTRLPQLRRWQAPVTAAALLALITRFHIYVRLDCDAGFTAEAAAAAFAGVEELTVEVFQARFGSSGYAVLRLFEGVRGVGRARVVGSVAAFPGYVAWLEGIMMSPEGSWVRKYGDGGGEVLRGLGLIWGIQALQISGSD